jgi:hypothetical protein
VLESLANWHHDDRKDGGIYRSPMSYAVAANDGLRLLRRHVRPEDRLFVMDAYNPFTYALGLRHPRGDAAWWHYGRVIDERHCPPPQRVLRDVTVVLQPKLMSKSTTEFMLKLFGPAVEAGFDKVDESTLYILYRRKNQAGPRVLTQQPVYHPPSRSCHLTDQTYEHPTAPFELHLKNGLFLDIYLLALQGRTQGHF